MASPRLRPTVLASVAATLALAALAVPASTAAEPPAPAVELPSEDLRWSGFLPLGDADGDGRDDVVFLYEQWQGASLASGAIGLTATATKEAWRLEPEHDLGWVPDLDGNGVSELLAVDNAGDGSATGQSVLVAGAYSGDFRSDGPARVLDGRALKDVGAFPAAYRQTMTQAYALPVVAYAGAYDYVSAGTYAVVAAPGQVFAEEYRFHSSYGSLSTPATGGMAYLQDVDATYTIHGLDGSVQASLDVTGPTLEPFSAAAGRFGGGPGFGVAALWWETTPYLYLSQGGTVPQLPLAVHLAVATGDGPTWTMDRMVEPSPQLTLAAGLVGLPDLDGDGADDLQYLEETLDLSGIVPETVVTSMLVSGRTGQVLRDETLANQAAIYYGFADDAHPSRLLRMLIDFTSFSASWSVHERYDAAPSWSLPADEAFPIARFDDLGRPQFGDVSGDGGVDLVMSLWREGEVRLQAFDGADGAPLWTAEVEDAYTVVPISADGRTDIVVPTATGHREPGGSPDDATAGFVVLDGSTGDELWSQVLRSPDTRPVDSDGYVFLGVVPLGDIDGDGAPDFSVSLQRQVSRSGDDFEMTYYETTAHLFSSGEASELASSASDPDGPDGNLTAALPPAIQAAPARDGGEAGGKGAPGLGLVAGVAVLGAVAAGMRRRR